MGFLIKLAILCVLVFLAFTVPLGKHTLAGHIRAIWHTEQVQDLKDGVEEKARPAIDRVKRGIHAAEDDGSSGSAAVAIDAGARP
jgi:hypothetical protein